jgi:5-deoxy-D-glucuronate isomerase
MGNPAMDRKKKSERRRKKYEQRLGPGVYLPREERLKVNAEVEKALAAAKKAKQEQLAKKQQAKQAQSAEKK